MSVENGNGNKPRIITESVSTRAIEALISNYRDPQQAFLELIDNAVDNRLPQQPLTIRIRVSKNELSVFNQGGKGLDFQGLEKFFVWGYSEKTAGEIGFYGVGGKAAMGYLGKSMEVVCSPRGSSTEYRVYDPSWETRLEGEWKQFQPEERKATTEDGYFRVRITNLKREVSANALVTKLSDIYRPLLLDGSVSILVNGKALEALQIKYVEDNPSLKPESVKIQTRLGDWIIVKVGVLEEGQRVKPGIRCYYNGRLIEDEQYFGHPTPTQLSQMSRLIGEAHLDSVPVTTNKSNFNKGSVQYDSATRRINVLLSPWVEKLAKLKVEQHIPVENYEKDLAKRAKRVLEHVFATTGLVTKTMLPGGESAGRLPPTKSHPPKNPDGRAGGRGPKEGQTAPHIEATISEIKRWGAMVNWEVKSAGSTSRRSDAVEEGNKQILVINSDYPLYQAAKKAGEAALELYMAETAATKISEIVTKDRSREEFMELLDGLLRECGSVYQHRIREKKNTTRGTIRFN